MHGGRINATSKGPKQGSQFEVRLPSYTGSQSASSKALGGEPRRQHRVLVVDDNRDAAHLLAEALTTLGHTVQVAYDAAQALGMLHQQMPDVALLDIGLPVIDGLELARRIREMPGGQDLVLMAVTGYGLPSDRQRAFEAGFNKHLTKPVDFVRLQEALEETMRESGVADES